MIHPVKILHITKSTAGVAEYVRWLANGLDHTLFRQTVICLSENSLEFAAELSRIPGVSAQSLSMKRYTIDPLTDGRVIQQLARLIRDEPYDLIHAHASKPGFMARLAALGSGIPVVYSPHCFSFHQGTPAWKAYLLAGIERVSARYLTTRIMTVAEGEQTLAKRYHVGCPDQFVNVYSGIDLPVDKPGMDSKAIRASMGIPAEVPLVGAVGRMSKQKSPSDFLHMAAHIHWQNPEVHFVWVGSGPLEEEMRQLSKDFDFGEVMHFVGPREDISDVLQSMDCFVLPSLWEGFSIVLLEAMAAGVPIVATDIPGNSEAIRSGVDGYLVPPKDPCALANAVIEILNNPSIASTFRQNCRERIVNKFSRKNMLDAVGKMYQQILLEKKTKTYDESDQEVSK